MSCYRGFFEPGPSPIRLLFSRFGPLKRIDVALRAPPADPSKVRRTTGCHIDCGAMLIVSNHDLVLRSCGAPGMYSRLTLAVGIAGRAG
jgi:hypothetical protein